ncbi:MAG: hypothetical protein K2X77_08955 [Candidatus Obscuribacterales bacterium]|jgi:hypothetical protein|nr:hypothetical protein [Candidatus Obscuribacterales bacterium]
MGNLVSSVLETESTLTIDISIIRSFNESSQDILEELNLPKDILSSDPIADASDVQDVLDHLLHWTDWRPASVF